MRKLRTQTRCPRKRKQIKMKKANREATIGIPEDYAEELAPCSFRGGGPRPVQAGWATQESTAATRERTATLGY